MWSVINIPIFLFFNFLIKFCRSLIAIGSIPAKGSSKSKYFGPKRPTARALAVGKQGPKYLLLDEPFAGIDPIAINDLQNLIRKLKDKNIGILITDHNVRATLAITNRAYILSQGEILAYGSSAELTQNKVVKDSYLGNSFD